MEQVQENVTPSVRGHGGASSEERTFAGSLRKPVSWPGTTVRKWTPASENPVFHGQSLVCVCVCGGRCFIAVVIVTATTATAGIY